MEDLKKLLAAATPGPCTEGWRAMTDILKALDDLGELLDQLAGNAREFDFHATNRMERDAAKALLAIEAAVNALPELLARVRRLEEALKFYADPNRWPNMPNPKNPHYDLEMDAGSKARFALHARAALNQKPGQ